MKNACINDIGATVLASAIRKFPKAPIPDVIDRLHRADADGFFDTLPVYGDMTPGMWVAVLTEFYDDYMGAYA